MEVHARSHCLWFVHTRVSYEKSTLINSRQSTFIKYRFNFYNHNHHFLVSEFQHVRTLRSPNTLILFINYLTWIINVFLSVEFPRIVARLLLSWCAPALSDWRPASPSEPTLQPQEEQQQHAPCQRSLPLPHCCQHQPCHRLDSKHISFCNWLMILLILIISILLNAKQILQI